MSRRLKTVEGPSDSLESIARRDRLWRERQQAFRRPGFYSDTNAARGARDRMILLERFTKVQLQMAYLKLLSAIHQAPEHADGLLPQLQAKADEIWNYLPKAEKDELEVLLSELDIFHLHRPSKH